MSHAAPGANTIACEGETTCLVHVTGTAFFNDDGSRAVAARLGNRLVELQLDAERAIPFWETVMRRWTQALVAAFDAGSTQSDRMEIPVEVTGIRRTAVWMHHDGTMGSAETISVTSFTPAADPSGSARSAVTLAQDPAFAEQLA